MAKQWILATLLFAINTAMAHSATKTTTYFETIKNNPQKLLVFLQNMPKGADLHVHTGGASMAENLIHYAHGEHFCVNRVDETLNQNSQCAPTDLLDYSAVDLKLYNNLIDAWSMRHFQPLKESGHDHFFATFGKFSPISRNHSADILAEITERAGEQNESYLELMVTPELAGALGKKVGWDPDFDALRKKLLTSDMSHLITTVSNDLDKDTATQRKILKCDFATPEAGCHVKVRYLFQILREQPPEQVFAQLLAGFEAASKDPRIVGINMVQPEDGPISMRDYKLHMQMVGYLHQHYPNVHISLHAGELNSTLVPSDGLRFHIHDAVDVANAERIGHGVDVAYEDHADQLLKEMAAKHIMVEINLSSNASILGIEGDQHPLPLYLQYGVPVALSTDDEGVLRTNLTAQYQRAILTYHFTYPEIKNMVRNGITYSFLPGKNLWQSQDYDHVVAACAEDHPGSVHLTATCAAFLQANEKAQLQWDLENRFIQFENHLGVRS